MKKFLLLIMPLYLVVLPALAGSSEPPPMCTAKTTAGYWGYTCEGEFPLGTPIRILGTCTSSKSAFWDCSGTAKLFGGTPTAQELHGQANNHADCTGTISYVQTIDGAPFGTLDINYVVFDHGDAIQGLPTNPGAVISCSLKRISRQAD